MTELSGADPIWDTAWQWVMLQHEEKFSQPCPPALLAWLQADARHQQAYDDACQIWQLTGVK